MNKSEFVYALLAALPEATDDPESWFYYKDSEPLPYIALGDARSWIEKNAIEITYSPEFRVVVRSGFEDAFTRYWAFVEDQAIKGLFDADVDTLLCIECFEHSMWVDKVTEYLGPVTGELLSRYRTAAG
ncbi:hypothetical protein [Lysinibacter cavernae]|uniref:Uncharacterized protein n=1 Tax=Lysinibacter cavernae TaxID=1640652 RepID=A0A7X5R0P3_9MICO|nr:hypothetical protein [Lysinibacter cavernae]NIH53534.1 hypothetical protein [Lysinibacter cavernae]